MLVTVERMRTLLESCPVPGAWHPGAEPIAACFADFAAAVESLERGEGWPAPRVAAARGRLQGMVDPEGRHPFVDEVVETLGAMREALDRVGTLAS